MEWSYSSLISDYKVTKYVDIRNAVYLVECNFLLNTYDPFLLFQELELQIYNTWPSPQPNSETYPNRI